MSGLRDTLAAIAATRLPLPETSLSQGRLREVTAFGPNPGELRMLVHAPDKLATPRSLVVVLHGCTQTAEGYAAGAGWLELADRFGFVLLCPEQLRANNPQLCFDWFQPSDTQRGGGEAASIQAMIEQAVRDHDIDRRRIFITGLSAGGAMANAMLSTYPEVFCAGAIIAGLPYGAADNVSKALLAMRAADHRSEREWGDAVRDASSHEGPWPKVSIWHGDEDRTVAPDVALALASQWTDVHGVGDRGVETATHQPGRRYTRWRSGRGDTVVELHRIAGTGHGAPLDTTAPDGCGRAGPFLLEAGVSSSLEIARSWGLESADALNLRVENAQAQAPNSLRKLAAETFEGHPAKVIADALRQAGLLR